MIFYHGTTNKAARQIIAEGRIRVTDDSISRYNNGSFNDTTNGYVYISNLLNVAWGYAFLKNDDDAYCVFQIDLIKDEVELDEDNLKNPTIVSSLYQNGEGCYRVNRDLYIGKEVVSYFCVKGNDKKFFTKIADSNNIITYFKKSWITFNREIC